MRRLARRMAVLMVAVSYAMAVPTLEAQRPLDVPYVPTPHEVVREMLEVAGVDSTDLLYDLGSGDGRIVVAAARDRGARGLGVDLNPDRVAEGIRNARRAGVEDRTEFRQGDLFELDLSPASVVTLYLLTDVNRRLRPQLLEQLRPGTRVVSHAFDMGDWEPDSTFFVPYNSAHARVYYWVIPADVGGRWALTVGARAPIPLTFEQRYQMVEGRGEGQRAANVVAGRLSGEEITLTLLRRQRSRWEGEQRLLGRVRGDTMEGTVEGTGERWEARRTGR